MDDPGKLTEPPPSLAHSNLEDLTAYWAPEVINRDFLIEGCESKIDYYSLGCVLLEMVSGHRKGFMNKTTISLPYFIPRDLKSLIRGLLDKSPLGRYGFELVTCSPFLIDVRYCLDI